MSPRDPKISDEAIEWFARLGADDVTPEEREAFEQWRSRSQSHAQAYEEARLLWTTLEHPSRSVHAELDRLSPQAATEPRQSLATYLARIRAWQPIPWAAAAGIAVIAALWLPGLLALWTADYSTAPGQQRTIHLADGSQVWLNTDTTLTVDFTPARRKVWLLEGEALFEAAPDPDRPFLVQAGALTARAVGTTFDIYREEDGQTRLLVVEGGVEARTDLAHEHPVQVIGGQQVSLGPGGFSLVDEADPFIALAWRRGQLVFTMEPLGAVIEDVNRYVPGKIVLINPSLHTHLVSGVLELDDLDAVVEALTATFDLRSTSLTDYLVFLY